MTISSAPVKVFNQSFSCLGPLVLRCDLDFTNDVNYQLDLTDQLSQGFIDYVSGVYIDLLHVTTFDLELVSNDINQRVYCKRGTIVYAPIFLGSWPKINCTVSNAINSIQSIIVTNIPFFPFTQTL